jgi:TolB protein
MNTVSASDPANSPTLPAQGIDPAGEWIAFAATDYTRWDIYLVRPDGSQLTRLEGEMEAASDAVTRGLGFSWSPDGRMFAFEARDKGNLDIFVGDLRTGSYRRLAGTDADDRSPIWTPDGQWIVFTSKDKIIQVSPDGMRQQTLVTAVSVVNTIEMPGYAAWPSFSPNGRYLVYSVGDLMIRGAVDIFVSDRSLPEKEPSVLIQNKNANDFNPVFAPVGFTLAFLSASDIDRDYDLYLTDLQSQPVKVTDHAAMFPFAFAWSPDGRKIAYAVQIGERSEIFVVELGNGGPIQLTGEPLSGETLRFVENGSRMPSWSPDSSRLVFQSNRDGKWAIYIMNADGSGQVKISFTGSLAISPAWRP